MTDIVVGLVRYSSRLFLLAFFICFLVSGVAHAAIMADFEYPQNGDVVSGVALIRGWAFDTQTGVQISQVELFIDGQLVDMVPCCSRRGDVQSAFSPPHPPESTLHSGFGKTFNWGNLSTGTHTVRIAIRTTAGEVLPFEDRTVTVVKLGDRAFINQDQFDLTGAIVTLNNNRLDAKCIRVTNSTSSMASFVNGAFGWVQSDQALRTTSAADSRVAFQEEFEGATLDSTQWDPELSKGNPIVSNSQLTLAGGAATAEIQSSAEFQYETLLAVIESSDWKAQNVSTDSSFGFEIFSPPGCHSGVILTANRHLGLLRPRRHEASCPAGDPDQEFQRITNWDAVRAGGRIYLTLAWTETAVTLHVSDGGVNTGWASFANFPNADPEDPDEAERPKIPAIPLKIRLNAASNETYRIDYVRLCGSP